MDIRSWEVSCVWLYDISILEGLVPEGDSLAYYNTCVNSERLPQPVVVKVLQQSLRQLPETGLIAFLEICAG